MSDSGEKGNPSPRENKNTENQSEFSAAWWRGWVQVVRYWRYTIRGLKKVDALITAIATVLLTIITGALAYIAYEQLSDTTLRETLVASNRAWIAPAGITATGTVEGDSDISVRIFYTNVGKSPALKLNQAFFGGSTPNTDKIGDQSLAAGPNKTCEGLLPTVDGTAVFPNSARDNWVNASIPRKLILPTVKTNDSALYLHGCWAYETMKEIHYTWFCYIVYHNGKLSQTNGTEVCKDGHGAK